MIELATTQDRRRRKIWKLNMFRILKTILSSLDTSSRLFKIPANSFVALASAVRITGVKVTVMNFRHQKKTRRDGNLTVGLHSTKDQRCQERFRRNSLLCNYSNMNIICILQMPVALM